jgi:hypothetical protein
MTHFYILYLFTFNFDTCKYAQNIRSFAVKDLTDNHQMMVNLEHLRKPLSSSPNTQRSDTTTSTSTSTSTSTTTTSTDTPATSNSTTTPPANTKQNNRKSKAQAKEKPTNPKTPRKSNNKTEKDKTETEKDNKQSSGGAHSPKDRIQRDQLYFHMHPPSTPKDQDFKCAGCGNALSPGLFSTIRYLFLKILNFFVLNLYFLCVFFFCFLARKDFDIRKALRIHGKILLRKLPQERRLCYSRKGPA